MREKIKLLSSAGTGHFYVTTKNKRLHPDKLEVRKFDPLARKHVAYKESKIKKSAARTARSRDDAPWAQPPHARSAYHRARGVRAAAALAHPPRSAAQG